MDIDRLNIFLDASQTLNFSNTSRRMHVSQSTVSKHIHDLENKLDVVLFDRSGTRLRLTQAGRALVPWAKQLVNECERFQKMAHSLVKEIAGPLRIACTTASGKYILPLLAVRFRDRFPHVDISMLACRPRDVDNILQDEKAELAVVSFETANPDLECQVFFYDQIILIVPPDHPWAFRGEIHPDDLVHSAMILREPTSGTRRALLSALAAHDISLADLKIILELGNAEAIVGAVAAGIGVSFVSRTSADFALEAGRVKEVTIPMFALKRKICMLRKIAQFTSRPAEVFWSFIQEPEYVDLINSIVQT
ncbi:MAG: LysR family transcriptional regulator [Anaerolineaceae bacterium]|nr:LysR family transcriptional regulator [Anaerolineaceae bacterium]